MDTLWLLVGLVLLGLAVMVFEAIFGDEYALDSRPVHGPRLKSVTPSLQGGRAVDASNPSMPARPLPENPAGSAGSGRRPATR